MTLPPTEHIELEAMRSFFAGAPGDVDVAVAELHGAVCTRGTGAEPRMLNRVVGLGLREEATETALNDIAAFFPTGTPWFVSLSPEARPVDLPQRLERRGFVADYPWMKFRRAPGDMPPFQTDLRVERIDRDHADSFAGVVADGYRLGREVLPLVASIVGSEGWDCYVAFADGEPAASGALFTSEGVGWLGMAATMAEFRRRGAQGALLATRIGRASERGCELLVTETGAEVEGRPSNSYRNIVRSGFEPAYVRPNYRAPA